MDINWKEISLMFPEWATDPISGEKEKIHWKSFSDSPTINNFVINSRFRKDYGIQIFLNSEIPLWIQNAGEASIDGKPLKEIFRDLSMRVYNGVISELDSSFEILESWRKSFIRKFDPKDGWKGPLQGHIDFIKRNSKIILYDYFHLEDRRGFLINPTDKLLMISKLPKESLNDKWLEYIRLSEYVEEKNSESSCNSIFGSSISNCLSNADKIYRIAEELKSLRI